LSGFQQLFDFESALAEFTGAPYVVVTDCCTHAIELAMRHYNVEHCKFTAYTYLSVVMLMHRLNIDYELLDQQWRGEYQFENTNIWDSARRLERNMYRPGQVQCLSFGVSKPLHLGRGGAILLDDVEHYDQLRQMRSDGRDLNFAPWQTQETFTVGYHYCPTLELCANGIEKLTNFQGAVTTHSYPDCRDVKIFKSNTVKN
jgi:dTDP-4-amino-4,6-dideoxygalactose transaminase